MSAVVGGFIALIALCAAGMDLCVFALWRNTKVSAYFHAVNAHVYEVNITALLADRPTLDWTVIERTMACWNRMIFMAWKSLPTWFPPEYRP